MCGGTSAVATPCPYPAGLSPRVRGNLIGQPVPVLHDGSIPACAGEPSSRRGGTDGGRVYPRVCGGTFLTSCSISRRAGLSPRVRGNLRQTSLTLPRPRSIPACAGEPACTSHAGRRRRVYPRVCGGTVALYAQRERGQGLSPRVRGNPPDSQTLAADDGSIPACAGEPTWLMRPSTATAVYPRVCGGTENTQLADDIKRGLSPRVRGNQGRRHDHASPAGSIPACAGEPSSATAPRKVPTVYPRVCGGTPFQRRYADAHRGLSPRVRGNQLRQQPFLNAAGSIPACAGEPRRYRRPHGATPVYPRVCGGTNIPVASTSA